MNRIIYVELFLEHHIYNNNYDDIIFYSFNIFFFTVYLLLRDRERQSTSGGGTEREGDTESKAGSKHRAGTHKP